MDTRTRLNRRGVLKAAALAGLAPASWANKASTPEGLAYECAENVRKVSTRKRMNLLLPNGSQSNLAPVISAFEYMTGLTVQVRIAPVDDINTRILLAGGEDDFDVALPATYGIADLAEAHAIRPLDDFVSQYEPNGLQDMLLYNAGSTYLGRFYGYQADGDVYLMFLNQGLARRTQLAERYEQAVGNAFGMPGSWRELDAMMALVHKPNDRIYGGSLFRSEGYLIWEFWLRMHEKGLRPLDRDGNPLIDHPVAEEALSELLAASHHQHDKVDRHALFENWSAYAQGNALINIGWGGSQKAFRAAPGGFAQDIVTFIPPGSSDGSIGLPYFNWGWNYTVRKGSPNAEAAYLFTLFATSPEISTQAVRAADGYFDPMQAAHYQDGVINEVYSSSFLEIHREAMSRCLPDFYVHGQGRYFAVLSRFLQLAFRQKLSVQQSLGHAARQWRRLHREFGEDRQALAWQELLARYPRLDESIT